MASEKTTSANKGYTNLFTAFGVDVKRKNMVKILNSCFCLDLIFSFSIFGYISIEPIAITTVHIPVILAGMLVGPTGGALTGLVFGLTSLWKASVTATVYGDLIFSPFKSGSPVSSLILSLGTRVLFGWVTGLLFMLLFRKSKKEHFLVGSVVISVICTLFHSFIVSLAMKLLFPETNTSIADAFSPSLRHITVWAATAAATLITYLALSRQKTLKEYSQVIQYKRSYKLRSNNLLVPTMCIFVLVSSAIVVHSFDRLATANQSMPDNTSYIYVNTLIQHILALAGAIYIIGLLILFIYDKGSIASAKLKEQEQEQAHRQQMRKTLDVMEALTKDYEIVMNTDIQTNEVHLYRCSEAMSAIVDQPSLDMPYYEAGERFYRMIACDEDLPVLLEMTRREKIIEYLKNDQIFVQVFKDKHGSYGESKIVPISDHEFVCGYTNVDKAIKEKMKQQEELEKAKNAAEAANKAKSAFLFNMSHDIRTPMNAIIGYTDILAKYRQDEEQFNRCTSNIKASGQYLLDLLNNVLEMARIESGAQTVDIKPHDARTFLSRTYIVFKEEAEKKNITLTYDRNIEHNFLYADKLKIQQIHLNIISNAIKYTHPGGKVRIFSQEIPDEREGWCKVKTTTTDTGVGMSEEFVEHIFDEFSREKSSTISGVSGTGLGMGIVKKLVEMLGGSIEIQSEKGKGTTVTVIMPHKIADESQVEKEDFTTEINDSLFKGKRVLLAEDNELNSDIATELLSDLGLEVDNAEDGIICVSKLETAPAGHYDLILMDVQMPNMDGYQATEIIRNLSDKQKANIPIIAMTANAFAKDRKAALASGMNDHVSKPISIDKLALTMAKFITK